MSLENEHVDAYTLLEDWYSYELLKLQNKSYREGSDDSDAYENLRSVYVMKQIELDARRITDGVDS